MEKIRYGLTTHKGNVRDLNEDASVARPEMGLWLVADGMGGHERGEFASAIVAQTVSEEVSAGQNLVQAIETAHLRIQSEKAPAADMGSTVVALKLNGNNYEIAWVGDSRGYIFTGNRLRQLTKDHSYVQELIDAGALEEEAAKTHPRRNVITRSVGSTINKLLEVELITGQLFPNDKILLCSDGLTHELTDDEISSVLGRVGNTQDLTEKLVGAALGKGGTDNITVVVVSSPEAVDGDESETEDRRDNTQPIDSSVLFRKRLQPFQGVSTLHISVALLLVLLGVISWWFLK